MQKRTGQRHTVTNVNKFQAENRTGHSSRHMNIHADSIIVADAVMNINNTRSLLQ